MDHGCFGGWMDRALKYIQQNGIVPEEDYPYIGRAQVCHVNKSSTIVKIKSYGYIKSNDETQLQKAVATIGPISVAIDASYFFQLYRSGENYSILNENI